MGSLLEYLKKVSNFFINVFTFKKNFKAKDNIQKDDLDKKLVLSLSKSRFPSLKQFKHINKILSPKEKWILRFCFLVIFISAGFWGTKFYFNHLELVPIRAGAYREGLIGIPKYINPLYASLSDVDSDLSSLIFSSLFKRDKNGNLANDIVSDYKISEDGKIYTIKIKDNIKWNDGEFLNTDDIIFTFNAIKNKEYNSPLRNSFLGVEIQKKGDDQFEIILEEPYAAFKELLTFGILPSHLWEKISPESATLASLNLKPIGSGPYKFKDFLKDESGKIKEYDLEINYDYYNTLPYIDLNFKFYPDSQAALNDLNQNQIDGMSYLPRELKESVKMPMDFSFHKLFIPQLTVLFINQQKNPILADKAFRQAVAYSINRDSIVSDIFKGDAYLVDSPILASSFAYNSEVKKYNYDINETDRLFNSIDWKKVKITDEEISSLQEKSEEDLSDFDKEKLSVGAGEWRVKDDHIAIIKLTTVNRNENNLVIELIRKNLEEVGVKANVEVLEPTTIQNEVIKNRDFEALFYGQVLGADPDPYVFWHSSQIGENGFNISNYENKDLDTLLEEARVTMDIATRQEKYKKFQDIIAEELPAIYLYSPVYIYIQRSDLKQFEVKNIIYPSDRFANINEWYLETGKKIVW